MAEKELKGLVRILNTDIKGELPLERGLRKIKGISFMTSNAIRKLSGIPPERKIGHLEKSEIEQIESLIKSNALPVWMLNRRNDVETGETGHVYGASISLRLREDINRLRRLRAYRGIRHELGQPVRGQRTRSSFRKGKSVGVSKKKIQEKKSGKK